MIDWTKPYERTETEFAIEGEEDPWCLPNCKHCGESKGYHWQTADGRIWCVRNKTEEVA